MPKRIRLTWNRNQDAETEYYRVFRDEQPEITQRTSMDRIVMKVAHPKQINPITVTDERMIRESERTYALAHKHILLEFMGVNYPFIIEVDGVETTAFGLDIDEGRVLFDQPIDPNSIVVAKTYTFDGVQVWDYEIEEPGKIYYGPEAKDTSPPSVPQNVTITKDLENNRLVLRWDAANSTGKTYYYRVDAAIDEERYSKLSLLRSAFIQEPLADRPYIIERSQDGKRWVEIARIAGNVFYEYKIDRQAPNAITGLKADVYLYTNQSKAQVTLSWDRVRDDTTSISSMYRVRARNRVGMTSEPSDIVGPIPFKVDLDHILIRRKIYNGTLPSFDGADAETVAVITDLTTQQFIEDVLDNNLYVYGLWVVDKAGNYSAIAHVSVLIGDATAPSVPTGLAAEQFQLVVG